MTAPPHAALVGAPAKPQPAPPAQPPAWARIAAPVLLIVLTSALAGYRLGAKSLWHDEAFSLALARSDVDTFWRALRDQESFAGLYYSILRALPMLGDSEATLRLPSVVFAVLATVTCFAVGSRLFGFGAGIAAAVLLDVNLLFLRYAQEARPYALVVWLITLAGWLLIRAVQRPTWPSWLAYGAIAALAVYAHFFAMLVVIAQLLSLAVHRSMVPWRRVAAAAATFVVLVLPLSVVLLSTNAGGRPLLAQASIPVLIRELAGVAPTPAGTLQGAAYALCCLGLVLAVWRCRREGSAFERWRYTLLACWLAVPIALAAAVSIWWPIFVTRYFVVCLPAAALLIAAVLGMLRPRRRAAVLLIVVLLAVPGVRAHAAPDSKEGENWRDLVQHVASKARPGDEVIFLSRFGRRPFEYYLPRSPDLASVLTPSYPSLPWGDYPPVVGERAVAAADTSAGQLDAAAPPRVWAVLLWGGLRTGDDDGEPFARLLTRDYVEVDNLFFGRYLKPALYERLAFPGSPDTPGSRTYSPEGTSTARHEDGGIA